MSKYTTMTLKHLRAEGYTVAMVERWIPTRGRFANGAPAGVRRDMLGLVDMIAFAPGCTLGVQSTGPTGHAAHRRAMRANPNLPVLLASGWQVWLVSWRKVAGRWAPRVENVGAEMAELLS